MLVTRTKVHHLPEPYSGMIGHSLLNCCKIPNDVDELMAYIRGEMAEIDAVENLVKFIQQVHPEFELIIQERENVVVGLECKDVAFSYLRGPLCRRFHFFDDYFSTFPESREVELPFTLTEVASALRMTSSDDAYRPVKDLSFVLPCLKYLNPKSAIDYFQFDPSNISDGEIESLASLLTDDEVTDLIEARYLVIPHPSLPRMGRDRPGLICLLEMCMQFDRILRLFPSYPSYYVLLPRPESADNTTIHRLLAECDFSKSPEVTSDRYTLTSPLILNIENALTIAETKECASNLLAMLDIKCKELDNEGMNVATPYRIKLSRSQFKSGLRKSRLRENLERLFGIPFPENWAIMMMSAKGEDEKKVSRIELETLDLDAIDFDD